MRVASLLRFQSRPARRAFGKFYQKTRTVSNLFLTFRIRSFRIIFRLRSRRPCDTRAARPAASRLENYSIPAAPCQIFFSGFAYVVLRRRKVLTSRCFSTTPRRARARARLEKYSTKIGSVSIFFVKKIT